MRVLIRYQDEKTGRGMRKIVEIDATPETPMEEICDLAMEALPDHPDPDYGWLFVDAEELDD